MILLIGLLYYDASFRLFDVSLNFHFVFIIRHLIITFSSLSF